MAEQNSPSGGWEPANELEAIVKKIQQNWQGFGAGPIVGILALL